MVQQTSLEAYFGHVLPTINNKQYIVLMAIIRIQPCTDLEIAKYTGLQINQVTPRRGELAKVDIIVENGKKIQNGRRAMTWVTPKYKEQNEQAPQGELFNAMGR